MIRWLLVILIVLFVGYMFLTNTNVLEHFNAEQQALSDFIYDLILYQRMSRSEQNQVLTLLNSQLSNYTGAQKTALSSIIQFLQNFRNLTPNKQTQVLRLLNNRIIELGETSGEESQNCYLGSGSQKQSTSSLSGYNSQGCGLYDNYNKCISCEAEQKCASYNSDGTVQCSTSCPSNFSCVNPPDDSPAGFGCPGEDFSSPYMAPQDPSQNDGQLCKYTA
jgi:type II secretory pathway pseudopilin PulG